MRWGAFDVGFCLVVLSSCEEVSSAAGVPQLVNFPLVGSFVPSCALRSVRQRRVGPRKRMPSPSVVCWGRVQVSTTLLPLRTAWRSATGVGNSSEGGRGGLGAAHANSATQNTRRIPDLRSQI